MKRFNDKHGIETIKIPDYRAAMNGIVERRHRTISECANAMMHHANITNQFWPYAFATANYLNNMLTT